MDLGGDNGATISATQNGDRIAPASYEVSYILTRGDNLLIEGAKLIPEFDVTTPGDYVIHEFVAETSDENDSNYFDFVVTPGITTANQVLDYISNNGLCASLDNGVAIEVVCTANTGTLLAEIDKVELVAGTATITAIPGGDSFVPTDYEETYILTTGTDLLVKDASIFSSFDVTEIGVYTIHAFIAETTDENDPNYFDFLVTPGVTKI